MNDEEIKEYWRTAYFNEKHKNEELEKKNEELKEKLLQERESYWGKGFECAKEKYKKQLTKAKELIRNVLTHGNYSLDWKVKAEEFLKEVEK